MSLSSPELRPPLERTTALGPRLPGRLAALTHHPLSHFATASRRTDSRQTVQTWLGLIWLLDGALQFQSYMYGSGFVQMLKGTASGQPAWLAHSVTWAATAMQSHQVFFNTFFALVQISIGLGLLSRRTVKPALALSFAWALIVWWFGEGFGMMFTTSSTPLTGAPGAAVLYALVGAMAWPCERPGGLLGVRGSRLAWGALWLVMAWLWLGPAGSSPNGVSEAIGGAPSGIGWLTSVKDWFSTATAGHGLLVGLALGAVSAVIGVAVARNWRARDFLILSVALNLAYWILGQGLGGLFAGGATDPNAAPVFMLLAFALYALVPVESETSSP